MGKPAVLLRHKLIILCVAALLACGFAPAVLFAQESVAGPFTGPESQNDARSASSTSNSEAATPNSSATAGAQGSVLASALAGPTSSIVSADVMLVDNEAVIGSFTVDGLTYSVGLDGLTLVAVDPAAAPDGIATIPDSVTYNGVSYDVTSIAPYAFYLSGVTQVELPATITSVDNRAFRSSDVERVDIAAGNPNYASFDGALYSADKLRLLLIPEGMKGSVLLSCETEVVQASLFSHCSLVDAISVEEGGAAFSSWNGLLYDASGTTLIRVPAGATDITIRDGCTAIAAGALEGCANLERIHAPATVTSISPDVFTSIPTVSLPAQSALRDEANLSVASSLLDQVNDFTDFIPQLTAVVALPAIEDGFSTIDAGSIEVILPGEDGAAIWQERGFSLAEQRDSQPAVAEIKPASDESIFTTSSGEIGFYSLRGNDHLYYWTSGQSAPITKHVFGTTGAPFYTAGWYKIHHAANANGYGIFKVIYSSSRGWHACRLPNPGPYMDVYPETPATSVSRTPTGPDLPVGTLLYDKEHIFFRYGPVIGWHGNGGTVKETASLHYTSYSEGASATGLQPTRLGYVFLGWYTESEGGERVCGAGEQTAPLSTHDDYYAHWGYRLDFETSAEPSDADKPGEAVTSVIVAPEQVDAGEQVSTPIPTRPGYVFHGWVIRNEAGTEAIDQNLVYRSEDDTWYVDAAQVPRYAVDGSVTLTARWTAQIAIDVPSAATFYYDLVADQSTEPHEAALSGQTSFQSQSAAPLRICGLESRAATGAAELFAGGAGTGEALMSLYPVADALTDEEAAKGIAGAAPAGAVSFALDDIVLEAAFGGPGTTSYAIPAGGRLALGYRLNLGSSVRLDYDKLQAFADGDSVPLTTLVYTFAMA